MVFIGPRFRLSRLDLEDIQNSKVIKARDWDPIVTKDLLKNFKKMERRKVYQKRIKQLANHFMGKSQNSDLE